MESLGSLNDMKMIFKFKLTLLRILRKIPVFQLLNVKMYNVLQLPGLNFISFENRIGMFLPSLSVDSFY